jgi:oligopeptide transport system substrate-binding protein
MSKKWSLILAIITVAGLVLAACQPEVVEVTRIVEQEKVVVETQVVVEQGQEKIVEVTKVIKEEVVVTATPEPAPPEPAPVQLEGLWYPLGTEPPTLDIQIGTDTTSHLVVHQCIEGLFEYRGDGSIEPAGATSYTVSDDGLVYTVDLRQDAVWSDGVPVIAQHYVDGVIRLLEPETAAEYAFLLLEDLEGAKAFNSGETTDASTVGVKALDDYTLEIRLAGPRSYFETILPFSVFYPVRLDIIEKYGDQWTEPGNYVSNGPYILDAWEHQAEVVLVKNPTYWGADDVTIDKITLPIIAEPATSLALYENGELHTTGGATFPSEDIPRILEDPVLGEELRISPRPGVAYMGLNTLRPPTDDVNVRKALASSIDRESLIDNVMQMPWRSQLTCTTPPTILGYQEPGTCGYLFDVEAAQAYLAEAGYPGGEGMEPVILWYNRGGNNSDIFEAVAAMWEDNLGISVELRTNEWAVYLDYMDACNNSKEDLAACEINAYRMGWVMDYGDPQNQLEVVFAPASTFQYTGWESARFDELIAEARSETDTATRETLYKEADKILCEEQAAIIPLVNYDNSILVKNGVTFEFPPFGAPAFKHWALP